MRVNLIHNGYDVRFFNNLEDADRCIEAIVSKSNVSIKKIFDRTFPGNKECGFEHIRIVRYKYTTLYEEDFIIEY